MRSCAALSKRGVIFRPMTRRSNCSISSCVRSRRIARYTTHMFDLRCREHGIEHRFTKINHPWTNGQVERMNRTIKDATVKRYHYDDHSAAAASRRLRRRLQFRATLEDAQRPHALRVHLKMLDIRPTTIQTQPAPANAGTEQLAPPNRLLGSERSFLVGHPLPF